MANAWVETWHHATQLGTNVLRLSVDGITYYDLTLTANAVWTDALESWETLANAHATLSGGGRVYTFSFDVDAATVTLACAGGSFYVTAKYSELTLMGFAAALGPGTSFTSTTSVYAFLALEGRIEFDIPEAVEQTALHEWRFGRRDAMVTGYGRATAATFWINTATWLLQQAGPLFNGKVRIHTTSETTAYALGNIGGVLDVYPHEVKDAGTLGNGDEALMKIQLLCTEAG